MLKILFLSDTHLGFDLPLRPRIKRRRRGDDFIGNAELALKPAREVEVDCVIHGGDVLFRSKVPRKLAERAYRPIIDAADSGVPIYLIPGNHERSEMRHADLLDHPNIHIFDFPRTFIIEAGGITVAISGFPFVRHNLRKRFPHIVEQTGWRNIPADIHLLVIHQSVDGATCGPADYMFRYDQDVIRVSDIPVEFDAVLCGHIHRRQVLTKDLKGRDLPMPVIYCGSTDRTSFAEKDEVKGYYILTVVRGENGSASITNRKFVALPTSEMYRFRIEGSQLSSKELKQQIAEIIGSVPNDSIVTIRISVVLSDDALDVIRAQPLRDMSPDTMVLSVVPEEHTYGKSHRNI